MQIFIRNMESPVRMKSRFFIERRPAKMEAGRDRPGDMIFHLCRLPFSFSVLALNVMTLWLLDPDISGTDKKGSVIPGHKRFT